MEEALLADPLVQDYIDERLLLNFDFYLEVAVYEEDLEMIKRLWHLNLSEEQRQEMLLLATAEGKKKIVRYLYSKGMRDLNTALLVAVATERKKLIKYFVKRGASNLLDAQKLAVKLNKKKLLKYL